MKKLLVIVAVPTFSFFIACNGAQHKTGNDQPDTGSKHGASGASDTINGSAAPFGQSTAGTDTSSNGHAMDEPTIDTTHPKETTKKTDK